MSRAKDLLRPYVVLARRLLRDPPSVNDLAWSAPRSFSQFGEDRFLQRYFADQLTGFYVDVGAYHPFSFSNTWLLYKQGWRGINLEPTPAALAQLREHRPRDINLECAVSLQEGPVTFALTGTFAGIDDDSHLWKDMPGDRITVPALSLAHILEEHLPAGIDIDFMDVDCEGHDLDALQSNDWDRYRPRLILAEAHNAEAGDELRAFAHGVGYEQLTQLDLTLVFERR